MKLHVFNPEHDLALANNDVNFVPPHAARQMGFDLSFIPTLWADGGDAVMVEDRQTAEKALSLLRCKKPDVKIVTKDDIKSLDVTYVDVWGWDPSICKKLHNAGVKTFKGQYRWLMWFEPLLYFHARGGGTDIFLG